MARRRRRKHAEEEDNHAAWAVPYGDLVTLLLAFFVVLYAVSSVNEGKYRVLSNTLFTEFRGRPPSRQPPPPGTTPRNPAASGSAAAAAAAPRTPAAPAADTAVVTLQQAQELARTAAQARALDRVAEDVSRAMQDLVRANLVVVRRRNNLIEVEIRTDILFPSGSATLSRRAVQVIRRLAATLAPLPNPLRVEGHTDSQPISTAAFPSNWELSAARAASVVHLIASSGVDPARLAVIGRAQYSPIGSNDTPEGRNANRRVLISILAPEDNADPSAAPADPSAAPAAAAAAASATTPAAPGARAATAATAQPAVIAGGAAPPQ